MYRVHPNTPLIGPQWTALKLLQKLDSLHFVWFASQMTVTPLPHCAQPAD